MKLDIEKLQHESYGRQSGRTTKMLVAAIQQSDFTDNDIVVVAHNIHYAKQLEAGIVDVAAYLGYPVRVEGRGNGKSVFINGCRYFFLSAYEYQKRGYGSHPSPVFLDHFAENGAIDD